jgi:hypothetical protein
MQKHLATAPKVFNLGAEGSDGGGRINAPGSRSRVALLGVKTLSMKARQIYADHLKYCLLPHPEKREGFPPVGS